MRKIDIQLKYQYVEFYLRHSLAIFRKNDSVEKTQNFENVLFYFYAFFSFREFVPDRGNLSIRGNGSHEQR